VIKPHGSLHEEIVLEAYAAERGPVVDVCGRSRGLRPFGSSFEMPSFADQAGLIRP